MYYSRLLLLMLLVVACRKKTDQFPTVQVVGHGGNGLHNLSVPYHDNTYKAVSYALQFPEIQAIEVDVQFSKDGTMWLFHDYMMDEESNSEGCIRNKTDEELKEIRYKGLDRERLTMLEEIAPLMKGKQLFLDLKFPNDCGETLSELDLQKCLDWVNLHFPETEVIYSFNSSLNAAFFQNAGCKVLMNAYSENQFQVLLTSNYWGLSIRNKDISPEFLKSVSLGSKQLVIYDIRSPKKSREALNKQPNFLFTDDIKTTLTEKFR